MRDRALLPAAGRFYKANLHCHTVLSDGRWTKEQVKAEYQRRGYSIVAFTDHRHYGWHPELMDDGFVPLAAYEADLNEPFPPSGSFQRVRTYHLNFYDTDPVARGGFEAVQPPQRYGDMEALNAFISGLAELPPDVAGHAIRRYRATGSTVLPPHGLHTASSADLAVEQALIVYPDEVASVDADGLPEDRHLALVAEVHAIARFHDVERLRRAQDGTMAGARMVAMTVGHQGTVDRPHGVDMKIAGRAIKPGRR